MLRKYSGDKKSIEARSDDGKVWKGQLFDCGRETTFSQASLKEVDELAAKNGMRLVDQRG
ncbi:MAG: hypothetical protein KDD82_05685 [Planctomycetes bacterium]|nr:hypothetical protein [Planctomycetota bacterium]